MLNVEKGLACTAAYSSMDPAVPAYRERGADSVDQLSAGASELTRSALCILIDVDVRCDVHQM
jgi:hypothetical protein